MDELAKKSRNDHYKQFVGRRKIIRRLRNEKRLSKIENKKRKETQVRKTKEELCIDGDDYNPHCHFLPFFAKQ